MLYVTNDILNSSVEWSLHIIKIFTQKIYVLFFIQSNSSNFIIKQNLCEMQPASTFDLMFTKFSIKKLY